MPRIFISSKDVSGDTINLTDKNNFHHLKSVRRVKVGEPQEATDETGRRYHTKIAKILPHSLLLKIEKKEEALSLKDYALTIACAIAKNAKIDDIIDKLTQLGVDRIIPMLTKRVIVKVKAPHSQKLERWNKIAKAAAQQSCGAIPRVELPTAFLEVISGAASYDLKLIPALIDEYKPLKEILPAAAPKNILVLIGPEGDFTPQELLLARKQGFIPVTLGKQVLRVDTAAVSVASFIKFYYENR